MEKLTEKILVLAIQLAEARRAHAKEISNPGLNGTTGRKLYLAQTGFYNALDEYNELVDRDGKVP